MIIAEENGVDDIFSHLITKGGDMVLALLIISGIGGLFCLYLAIECLLTASRENALPDIEGVDIYDTLV